ncbi:MAG TPA: M56 family metallopeptidase, partial [Tepidisphaeraceae bacterium]|nr:M56 family metallopeptidase [Tepidisphaeraceae bacterium]
MSADEIFKLGVAQLAQVSLAIVAVSLLTRIFCRRRPHLAYVFWILVLIKSLMPPIWSSPLGVFSWARPARSTAVIPAYSGDTVTAAQVNLPTPSAHLATASTSWHWVRLAPAIWIAGGIALLLAAGIRAWRIRREIDRCSISSPEELRSMIGSLSQSLGVRRGVTLRLCAEPVGPAVFGILRPVLVMPASLLEVKDSGQLRTIAAHEIIHLRRRDPLMAGVQLLSQAIWWFNPLVWWMNRQINQTRESCCDAEVIANLPCPAEDYAQTLIDVLRQRRSLRWSGATMGIRPVTQSRIELIMKNATQPHSRMLRRYWVLAALCGLLILPGAGILSAEQRQPPAEPHIANAVGSIAEVTHFVRIVVDSDTIRFQGQPVKIEQLPIALAAVSDRSNTV